VSQYPHPISIFHDLQYYEGSDSCLRHHSGRSPHLLQLTFLAFRSQPLGRPSYRLFAKLNVTDDFQASSLSSRLAALPCRIGFVILRTALSLPVALHPISRWRSYFPLRRYGIRRQGLSPCW